jgi:hypothetical protein
LDNKFNLYLASLKQEVAKLKDEKEKLLEKNEENSRTSELSTSGKRIPSKFYIL